MQDIKPLLDQASNILVTSHISPDPDAICSALLLGQTLSLNFPDKKVSIVLEETPTHDYSFLPGYQDIQFGNLYGKVEETHPDLLIIVDANNFNRCSRLDGEKIAEIVKANSIQSIIIDHHEPADKIPSTAYINQGSPACTQDIYEVCFDNLALTKPDGYEKIAILGIIADTARFKYANPRYRETFRVVTELLDAGASIEETENRVKNYSLGSMKVVEELAKNLNSDQGYTYTLISDEFLAAMDSRKITYQDIKNGCDLFNNDFIRSIESNQWGFLIYPEVVAGQRVYSASFRSISGVRDVAAIAAALGGGGHKSAAGAKLETRSVVEALQTVQAAIKTTA